MGKRADYGKKVHLVGYGTNWSPVWTCTCDRFRVHGECCEHLREVLRKIEKQSAQKV